MDAEHDELVAVVDVEHAVSVAAAGLGLAELEGAALLVPV